MIKNSNGILLFLVALLFCLSNQTVTINNCYKYSTSGTLCTICDAGYYITSSGASCTAYDCSAMTQCTLCESTTSCLQCEFGYYVNAGKTACVKYTCDDSNCETCSTSAANSCYSCLTSYYTDSYVCQSCSANITHCDVCELASGSLTCSACASTYYTDTASSCALCSSGDVNCYNCDSTGAGTLWCWDCL